MIVPLSTVFGTVGEQYNTHRVDQRKTVLQVQCKLNCNNGSLFNSSCIEQCVDNFDRLLSLDDTVRGISSIAGRVNGPTKPRLLCREERKLVLEWTQQSIPGIPIIFVLDIWLPEEEEWQYLNVTDQMLETIHNLRSEMNYKFRVTALTTDGQIGVPSISEQISTLSDDFTPATVENVTVDQYINDDGDVNARVTWQPAQDRTCYYDVDLRKAQSEGAGVPYRSAFVYEPKNLFTFVLDNLAYETNYTVIVRGKISSKKRKVEGGEFYITFLTVSCLEVNDFNTSICRPNAPKDLSVQETMLNDSASCQVRVSWSCPETEPLFYSVQFFNTEPPLHINVSGNSTEVIIPIISISTYYKVEVGAYTYAGYGEISSVVKTFENMTTTDIVTASPIPPTDSYYNTVFVILITLLILTLIGGTSLLIYHQNVKHIRYEQRCQYFESLDKKLSISSDFNRSKTVGSYGEDDWEIPLDRLLLGDILGEGAFGIVRQGLLQAHSHGDQPMIEVAVKMLRDGPSLDEVRQFHQEIEMMKTVGKHVHIVSIIGCCTQTNTRTCMRLMLITEYCALGDLQQFLRKEWNTFSGRNTKNVLKLNESRPTPPELSDSEPIQYAELLLATERSTSNFAANNTSLVINQLYDIESDGKRRNSEVERPLTANDLLSFARQITMGMEFLSVNRVVHRDLAARNILVCSNRTIKISDFGLSRDIYEENVYRKKGMGKLPIKWMAIESLSHQVYTTQSDVWSFGVLLWEIVTLGGNPYPSIQTDSVFRLLRSGYRMDCPTNCSPELYEIMIKCWKAKPKDRPTFAHLHHRFDELLEGCTHDQYLNLDLTDISSVEH